MVVNSPIVGGWLSERSFALIITTPDMDLAIAMA